MRLAYNDALTYDAATGTGGVKASWKFREFAKAPQNKAMQGLVVELDHLKASEESVFDKLSHADFAVAAAYTTITWAGGPVMLDEFYYGRKDAASVAECGKLESVPIASNYVTNL